MKGQSAGHKLKNEKLQLEEFPVKATDLEKVVQGDCDVSIPEIPQKLVHVTCSVAHDFKFFSLKQRDEDFCDRKNTVCGRSEKPLYLSLFPVSYTSVQ